MQPHQQRVVDEKTDLDNKLTKLSAFIEDSPIYTDLNPAEKNRLCHQRSLMTEYSDVLGQRIAAF